MGMQSRGCLVCVLVLYHVALRKSWEGSTDRRGSRGGGGATSEELFSLETHAGDVIRKEPMVSKRSKVKDFVQDSFLTDVEQPQERKGLFRLLQEARGEQKYIMWALVLLLLGSAVSFLLPAIAASSVDILLHITNSGSEYHEKDDAQRRLNGNFALMLSLSIFSSICSGFRGYLFTAAGERLVASIRARLFASLLQQEVAFHDDESTGSLLSRLSEDTLHIKDACTVHLSIGARNLLTGILSMAGMIFYSWQLSLVALMMMPALFFLIGFHSSRVKVLSYQVQFSNARAMATASESFMAIKMVKAFGTEQKEGARYEAAITEILQLGMKYSFAYGVFIFVITLASVLGLLLIMWYGSVLVLRGSMTIGTLIGFAIYAFSVVGSLTNMGATVSSIAAAVGSSQRVWELMDRRPQIKQLDKLQPKGHPEGASVSLENVWFSYPSRPSQWVLQDLTIEIKPGTKTALVGPSGGGKTTVVNLIERFFDPNKGLVKFDDMDIRKVDEKWLHKNMGIVSQDPILFGDTIAYNITYALSQEKCSEEDMINAAKLANAHDFIMKLPQGYSTVLGEHGTQLSGGQRQRIAIARAILMQPRLLLLDEATSALDSETESLVEEALNKLMHGRTVLVIAHRLSTVVNAHQVILMHEGKVQEQGNHAELLDKNGMYAALVQKQLLSRSGVNRDEDSP